MKLVFKRSALCTALSGIALTAAHAEELPTVTLDRMVVTAAGYEQKEIDAPASITVITQDTLKNSQYKDITDVLRSIPGVLITGSGSQQRVSIRGMDSNYTLFMVDGKRQFSGDVNPNGDDNGFEKNILPPINQIERIEIIRGPASTLHGSDAMGGAVNIITKKVSDSWGGSLDVGTIIQDNSQSGDIKEVSAAISGPLIKDKLGIQLSASKREREADSPTSTTAAGFRGNERESVDMKLAYHINDNHDIVLSAGYVTQVANYQDSRTKTDVENRNYRGSYALTHDGYYGNALSSKSFVQYEHSKNPDRANTRLGTSGITLETLTAQNQWSWHANDKHHLVFGLHYKDEKLDDKATNSNISAPLAVLERWSMAGFLENNWQATEKLKITAGVRYDHDEKYSGHVTPRLYGVYDVNDHFNIKAGIATGYKSPSIKEASDNYYSVTGGGGSPVPQGRGIIRGNSSLKPESSVTGEIGFNWHHDHWRASLSGYVTDFKDRISEIRSCESTKANRQDASTWQCYDANGTVYMFISDRENIDKAQIKGIEASLDYELNPYVTLEANYTHATSKIKGGQWDGQPLNAIPKHVANLGMRYKLNDKINLWQNVHYRSKTSPYLGRARMSDGNPAYTFFDVGMNMDVAKNTKLKFGVYNLLDKKAENASGDVLLDGRRYGLSLTTSF